LKQKRRHDPRRADHVKRFDDWSSTYERSWTWKWFFNPVHSAMMGQVGDVAGKDVLDLGCGTGDMLRRFAGAGARNLTGIDLSEGMLDVARTLSSGIGNIQYVKASAESLPFPDGQFDTVMSVIAFHHFPDGGRALSEAHRVLKPDGMLYICDMCGEGLSGKLMLAHGRAHAADNFYYTRLSLSALMVEEGFEPLSSKKVHRFPPAMLLSAAKSPLSRVPQPA
jgi:ubiquinone/menaquinone biosynthesis C-methylase UbiE